MDKARCAFTVVTPTLGRLAEVRRLLESLSTARKAYAGSVEILIIDDSSPDAAGQIRDQCETYEARYVEGPVNVREKRNLGVKLAKNPFILFIDSDCWVSPSIFIAYDQAYRSHPGAGGAAGPIEFHGASSFVWTVVSQTRFVEAASRPRWGDELTWAGCANLSFKRAALDQIGLFDTSLPFRLGGDDVDLCLRLGMIGLPLVAAKEAVVFHDRAMWANWIAILRRAFRWGRVEYHLCQRRPSLRRLAFPRFWVVLALMLVVGILKVFLTLDVRWLLSPLIWGVLSLTLFALLDILASRPGVEHLVPRVLTAVPELTYQLGLCYEAMRRREPSGTLCGLYASANWAEEAWQPELFNVWANLLAMLGTWLWLIALM